MSSLERFERVRPLEELEVALLQAALDAPGALGPGEEATLRWAFALAHLGTIGSGDQALPLEGEVAAFRNALHEKLAPLVEKKDLQALAGLTPSLLDQVRALRASILLRYGDRLNAQALDQELRQKKLVLALGGGGGTGYVYLGVFALLEELGITPAMISATSMGAILELFRARRLSYDPGEILGAIRGLSWSRLFRFLSTESRYGLPAALRLYLRGSLSRHVQHDDGTPYTLRDLPIPMIVTVSGIGRGKLPRPLAYYEKLVEPVGLALRPWAIRSKLEEVATASSELASPSVLTGIHLGLEEWTRDFDVIDAVGFSSAVPGLIHYDVLRRDPRMHELLARLFEERELFRLVDGGLTQNVPAEAAWRAIQDGRLGTRNTVILALDGFAPKLRTPLWLPLQRIAAENVKRSSRFAHLSETFPKTPAPTELIPSVHTVVRAIQRGRERLQPLVPLLQRLLQPLPPVDSIQLPTGTSPSSSIFGDNRLGGR